MRPGLGVVLGVGEESGVGLGLEVSGLEVEELREEEGEKRKER